MTVAGFDAVFWDFGGVLTSSPFDAFNEYEEAHGLPRDFIRGVNAVAADTNAWARVERGDIDLDEFDVAFAEESERLGHRVSGRAVLSVVGGTVRPEMVLALDLVIDAGLVAACLTNNFRSDLRSDVAAVMRRFSHVIESSVVGCRKPEPRFYDKACAVVGVAPDRVVYLDDLGINLKPARAMGMTTIKVVTPDQALDDLEEVLDLRLR